MRGDFQIIDGKQSYKALKDCNFVLTFDYVLHLRVLNSKSTKYANLNSILTFEKDREFESVFRVYEFFLKKTSNEMAGLESTSSPYSVYFSLLLVFSELLVSNLSLKALSVKLTRIFQSSFSNLHSVMQLSDPPVSITSPLE